MNNGLVRRRPRSAETGEFGVYAVALQNIGGRYRLTALLVGHRALRDRPVDATGEVVLGRVSHVLEATIDNRFECVEPLLRFLPRRVPVSSLPSIVTARRAALAACTAVWRAPAIAYRSSLRRPFIAALAATRLAASRASVWRGSVLRRSRLGSLGG